MQSNNTLFFSDFQMAGLLELIQHIVKASTTQSSKDMSPSEGSLSSIAFLTM